MTQPYQKHMSAFCQNATVIGLYVRYKLQKDLCRDQLIVLRFEIEKCGHWTAFTL